MAEPVRVGDLLAAVPGLAGWLAEARLLRTWPEIAGPAAARSRAECIESGVLQVAVDSSGWLHRLTLEETAVLARCRQVADIRAIRFHLASRATGPVTPPSVQIPPEGEVAP